MHLTEPGAVPTLIELTQWLQYDYCCKDFDEQTSSRGPKDKQVFRSERHQKRWAAIVLQSAKKTKENTAPTRDSKGKKGRTKFALSTLDTQNTSLSQCTQVTKL